MTILNIIANMVIILIKVSTDMAVIQPPPNMKICIYFHGKIINEPCQDEE
ncbi:hypothetical protein MTBBW1_160016 [Desulfamplus magnetovallimortis]|uniref:Uncharacterized protein n=1 Tax=Desulfamplus magnetovallimortis TaxID=1246637 RepID=A0A1W1H8V2_9BACT|nr:hypothetical protein MTBBW1_160016 [Desulfamplus magnetovallimortis]